MLSSGFYVCSDESGPQKSPWGINIMKKTKKVVPKAFGVRLEDCQPGVNNKVGADHLSAHLNVSRTRLFRELILVCL